ncbi:MAG: CCA tRNA nucleotidyltransferase [Actinomycetota bacterium]
MKTPIPPAAEQVAREFERAGKRVWLVGGWVRDALLNRSHTDLDLATDATPQESSEILHKWAGKIWTTGIEFGTVGAQRKGVQVEVTTFRTEVYSEDSRNPTVNFAHDLETDLSRRDFTINAMAISLPDVTIVDPFGGMNDLAARRLRTPLAPEVSFADDPLRMLRALRFVSSLEFEIDPLALEAIRTMRSRLAIVSKERIREEFSKLMLGPGVSKALWLASETDLAEEFLPELPSLKLEQDPIHRHKDVFTHTLVVLENVIAAEQEADLALRLGALLHDIGKPKTRRIGPSGVSFHHHEVVGADMAEMRLKELRYPSALVAEVRELVYLHLRFHTYRLGWTDRAVRRYVRDAGALLGKLNTLVRADCTTRNVNKARQLSERMDELQARIRELAGKEELGRLRPALDGRQIMNHLDMAPGPLVGDALDFLMEVRLDEGEIEEEEAFRRLDEWWKTRS